MRLAARELQQRAARLAARLVACDLCPRRCRVDRLRGELGYCGAGRRAPLAAATAHHGEEPPLSGSRGAGTLFFGGCNLRCTYCQNHQISRMALPMAQVDAAGLCEAMLRLQDAGCHNIELVTPSHVVAQILSALALAAGRGLNLPIVYNCGGYEALTTLAELDGVVDVYLPDLKYARAAAAARLSEAADYWDVARAAITEMARQCGSLDCDAAGHATRGVLVRHLVLPRDLAGTAEVLEFLAALEPRPAVSLMAQFYPAGGCDHPDLQHPLQRAEYAAVRRRLAELDLDHGWVQDLDAAEAFRPDFRCANPFGGAAPADG